MRIVIIMVMLLDNSALRWMIYINAVKQANSKSRMNQTPVKDSTRIIFCKDSNGYLIKLIAKDIN